MGYSARRGFTNGKISGAARQAELQQKIAAMQEKMTEAQDAVEAQEFTASVGGGVCGSQGQRQEGSPLRDHQAGGRGPRRCGNASGSGGLRRQRGAASGQRRHGQEHGRRHRRSGSQRVRPVSRTCKAVQEYTVGLNRFPCIFMPENREPSSKQACCIRRWRRFACFPLLGFSTHAFPYR